MIDYIKIFATSLCGKTIHSCPVDLECPMKYEYHIWAEATWGTMEEIHNLLVIHSIKKYMWKMDFMATSYYPDWYN